MKKQLIKDIANNPALEISMDNDVIILTKNKMQSTIKIQNLVLFLLNKRKEINIAFQESYDIGIDCFVFQKKIDELCKSINAKPINFLLECTSSWMSRLSEEIKAKPLTSILLPGTHDSGSDNIIYNKRPVIIDNNTKKLAYFCMNLCSIGNIIKLFVVTQDSSIEMQLQKGCRLFDFRLGKDSKNELYLTHTFLVNKFSDALIQVKNFLLKHPKEIVVINLKVDFAYRNFINNDDKKIAIESIHNILGGVINNEISMTMDTTIKTCIELNNRCIIYCHDFDSAVNKINFKINSDNQEIWPNKPQQDAVMAFLRDQILNNSYKKMTYVSFNTTPDAKSIVSDIFTGRNLIKNGREIQKKYGEELLHLQSANKTVCGIIFDSPTDLFMQKILNYNFQTYLDCDIAGQVVPDQIDI
jgi:hypothetical protein